jgi:predicted ribosome quality control (RQC) complex YloA/Tae2 family protein
MSTPLGALMGSRIRRVDVPDPNLLVLGLAQGPTRPVLVFSTDPAHPGFGCLPERPRGRPAQGVAKQLRNMLEGARLERALVLGGALALDLRRGTETIGLVHESLGDRSNVFVLDAEGRIVTALCLGRLESRGLAIEESWSPFEGEARELHVPEALSDLLTLGQGLIDARRDEDIRTKRRALRRAITRERRRIERRASATLEDLERAADASRLREQASLILAHLRDVPKGATEVVLPDFSGDPQATVTVKLNPELGARANADAFFARARKLETGAVFAQRRHDEARNIAQGLESLEHELETADDDALDAFVTRALALGAKVELNVESRRHVAPKHSPFRQYRGAGDRTILVGKGARDNDALTFEHASPHDLWLHVRGTPGSHVIVPLSRGETCPEALFIDAAHLAAHFSSARNEPRIEVQATLRKYVRKPRGGAPGAVIISNEKSLLLRVDRARLEQLLSPRHDRDQG